MRVLLDECLPRRLKRDLVGHESLTASEMGCASKRNGELLRVLSAELRVGVGDRAVGQCKPADGRRHVVLESAAVPWRSSGMAAHVSRRSRLNESPT